MSYRYEDHRESLFNVEGLERTITISNVAKSLLDSKGKVVVEDVMKRVHGSSWDILTSIDMLVERGYLREISVPGCFGQHRTFVGTGNL